MPGPAPKRSSQRQRRNTTTTAASFEAEPARRVDLPERESPWACAVVVDRKGGCPLVGAAHNLKNFAEREVEPHEFKGRVLPWHPLTVAWWTTIWDSPMVDEWVDADVPALIVLAALVDDFWRFGDKGTAAEIRMQQREFGLSPLSRRTLQWEIKRAKADSLAAPRPQRTPAQRRSSLDILQGGRVAG